MRGRGATGDRLARAEGSAALLSVPPGRWGRGPHRADGALAVVRAVGVHPMGPAARCPTGSATQFEEITGWTDERLIMSGYGQGTYADFDPTAFLIGVPYEDFVVRCRSETF